MAIHDLSPEYELIVCCARCQMDADMSAGIETLVEGKINWDHLLRSARENHAIPLLYRHLSDICPGNLPDTVLDQLRQYFNDTVRQNLFQTGELVSLLGLFESHAIMAVPLKGPVLGAFFYDNLGIREFSDLDILIQKQDVPQAREILADRGYKSIYQMSASQEAANLCFSQEWLFVHSLYQNYVDLHWCLLSGPSSFLVKSRDLWGRFETIPFAGTMIRALSREDLILFLCIHGAKHGWRRLIWICDIAELIRYHQEMDWDLIIEKVDVLAVKRVLFLGLFLANNLLGAQLPEHISRKTKSDPVIKKLAGKVEEMLFSQIEVLPNANRLFFISSLERWQDKIKYFLMWMLRPNAMDWGGALSLPVPFYCLTRPLRLFRKYIKRLLKRIF